MTGNSTFHTAIREAYEQFLEHASHRFPQQDTLRVDLHCHDHNSDIPDELWGRLLRLPETWLKTDQLVAALQRNHIDLITVTNHNNARSCWELLDKGHDILVGAEFTCHFPDSALSIHVLVYGFSPEQEVRLNQLRHNLYQFCGYLHEHQLPAVLPHPLFFYTHKSRPSLEILEKFAVLFKRFEVLNGQRGYWQNHLTERWVASLTPEKISDYSKKHGLNPEDFNVNPYEKSLTGGSDDHNGIFAGRTGSLLYVPDLAARRQDTPLSALALDALRAGHTMPYGEVGEEEKLTVTFLDYFAQVATHMDDPGLLRMLLHKGSLQDKVACFAISNAMQELKRHKYTLTFLLTFHDALHGKKPALLANLGVTKEFKPALKIIKRIAKTQRKEPDEFLNVIRNGIPELHNVVSGVLWRRLHQQLDQLPAQQIGDMSTNELIQRFELPTHMRTLFGGEPAKTKTQMTQLDLGKLFDSLTFPALASAVIAGASFAASQVIYSNREFLNELAGELCEGQHSQRILWLTDTFVDKNGVASALNTTLKAIQKHNYPIDILTCHPTLEPQAHLKVMRPVSHFQMRSLGEQTFYLPDLLELQRVFEHNGYDRIICSTEFLMGGLALFLKHAFSVPAHFYMHTDWLEFLSQTTQLAPAEIDRIRRMLRTFYQQFDGIFALNSDHGAWLSGPDMGINSDKIHLTAHWIPEAFGETTPFVREGRRPRLLFVGRISEEKGVMDLPLVYHRVKEQTPNIELWITGNGPALENLQAILPEAHYISWVEYERLPELYKQADLLLLPSRFDTFGCVVLEALSCELPVIAYNCKGPKDIIEHERCGYLVETPEEMAMRACAYLKDTQLQEAMRTAARARSEAYHVERIMQNLIAATGINDQAASPAYDLPDLRHA
ncbi:glycosyltransferase [Neptunomonas sp. XY-337]|uniref:glycosyltransferase n=1 Tax=Neptunomonas sp. XY-337 TaxID=2561897 RepID=UPI0010AA2D59|nr:glycosyltransferase [Neptunomonas sp. XY-337]